MSVRLRRLKADFDKLCTIFTQKSRIQIKKTIGDPPEKYQIEYLVTGMEKSIEGPLHLRSNFLVEITLTGSYPRMAPQCKMLTPVFHPNIAPHAICIGDHWAAGESLANLVVRIAEMLAYQSYNLKSPLNGDAAKWTDENRAKLPLDTFDFTSLLSVGEAVGRTAEGGLIASGSCANCGKKGDSTEMMACINSHVACSNCILSCPCCQSLVCLKCTLATCATCGRSICHNCAYKCGSCSQVACTDHQGKCHVCEHGRCNDCLVECMACGQPTCVEHIKKVTLASGTREYLCTQCTASVPQAT